ncbi:MAG: hypothetical protein O7E52_05085 [Candidatus Poribacteria bacterium]|nr:hypothetical protein [Candidatus Poribacteria bacterium]
MMTFEDLKPLRVETGISFGQECYLNPSRAEAFRDKINEIFPNFFTRHNFQQLPQRFILENPLKAKGCVVALNRLNYIVFGAVNPDTFLDEVEKIFDCFSSLFALDDVRRIGKIFDFRLPQEAPKDFLTRLLVIEEAVQINNLQLLFRRDGRNINIHFIPIPERSLVIEVGEGEIELEPGVKVRCDINNINMDSPLEIPETFKEIFGFADQYIQTDLIDLLNKYLGD